MVLIRAYAEVSRSHSSRNVERGWIIGSLEPIVVATFAASCCELHARREGRGGGHIAAHIVVRLDRLRSSGAYGPKYFGR